MIKFSSLIINQMRYIVAFQVKLILPGLLIGESGERREARSEKISVTGSREEDVSARCVGGEVPQHDTG